ncbi:MAG: SBBP repeat-containing protein [Abditibacteriota bacterium]|nr:SBBP repeat-containing protein [Abditibacteriota bacterium]
MKKIVFLLILLLIGSCVFSNGLIQIKDNSFVWAGGASNFADIDFFGNLDILKGEGDAYIMKYSSDLKKTAERLVVGDAYEYFTDVCEDRDGYIYAVGDVQFASIGTGDFKGLKGHGQQDMFVAKFDKDLNLIKILLLGGPSEDYSNDIIASRNGFVYVVGRTYDERGVCSGVIYKIFEDNMSMTNASYFKGSFKTAEDAKFTNFTKIIESNASKLIVLGNINSSDGPDGVSRNIIMMYNSDLNIMTKNSFKELDGNSNLQNIIERENGGYYIVGNKGVDFDCSGYLFSVDKDLKFVSGYSYRSYDADNKKAAMTFFNSIDFLNNGEGYLLVGEASNDIPDAPRDFYVIFRDGKFISTYDTKIDRFGGSSQLVTSDNKLIICGILDEKFVIKSISLF